MTREQTTPDAPKRLLDMPVPGGDRVRDDAGQRFCAVAGDAPRVQDGAGHIGAGCGDAAGAEGVAAGRCGELIRLPRELPPFSIVSPWAYAPAVAAGLRAPLMRLRPMVLTLHWAWAMRRPLA